MRRGWLGSSETAARKKRGECILSELDGSGILMPGGPVRWRATSIL